MTVIDIWAQKAVKLLQKASTPWGIKASNVNIDNYGAIFTRDAVMSGIAGLMLQDSIIIAGLANTLHNLRLLQGRQGQIASNYTVQDGVVNNVSYGTMSPKIDACTCYLIGVSLMIKEKSIDRNVYEQSVVKTIDLLEGIEYNGKGLMYIPKGGNWADEYVFEGYILYDQILRSWALSFLGQVYNKISWSQKAAAINLLIDEKYWSYEKGYFNASIYPGGVFDKFDLAAHALLGMLPTANAHLDEVFAWISETFLKQNKMPVAFYPVIEVGQMQWNDLRSFHLFDFKNKPHHYHNGGIWWIWLGWLALSLAKNGKVSYLSKLVQMTTDYLNQNKAFNFEEYLSADELKPQGTPQLCYTATGILFLSLAQDGNGFAKLNLSTNHIQ